MRDNPLLFDDPFQGGLKNRAHAERQNASWVTNAQKRDTAQFLPFFDLKPLIDVSGETVKLKWLSATDVTDFLGQETCVLLGLSDAGAPLFALTVDSLVAGLPEGASPLSTQGKFIDTRSISLQVPAGEAAVVAQARALLDWHLRHPFCAVCGSATQMTDAGAKRTCPNPDCGADHFPRTDPVVIMMIVDGDDVLLGRPARLPKGLYTALAGFIEQGETMEEAVRREVFEESGIVVDEVRYVLSQPWPWPSNLMFGCIGRAASRTIHMDADEMEDVGWYTIDHVRQGLMGSLDVDSEEFRLPAPMTAAHHIARHWLALRDAGQDPFA